MAIEIQSPSNPAKTVIRNVSASVKVVGSGARSLAGRMPGTVRATHAGASATTRALQSLPDSTLRGLAAGSAGIGTGLLLAGRRRMAIAAGVASALVIGTAIALRPAKQGVPTESE
jgi:hypothetical protein